MHPGEQHRKNDRFWSKVSIGTQVFNGTRCWQWTSAITTSGHGTYWVSTERGSKPAHVFAYEVKVGPVPEGLELDHLCRNRPCVNPKHLEPVTHAENLRRSPLIGKNFCNCRHKNPRRNQHVNNFPDGSFSCKLCKQVLYVGR